MSNVTLTIGGRPYTVSASDGEESHVEMLGRIVAERVTKAGAGQSETRMLLFAALMLADELHELHRQMPPPQQEAPEPAQPAAEVLARIETLAARVEKLAAHLEEPAT